MELYKLIATVNNISTTLATSISGSVTSVVLTSAVGFPSSGVVKVGTTRFIYTSITTNTLNGVSQTMGVIGSGAVVSSVYDLLYLPENFEGMKINQKFSFVNPIGFTPKFSVDTMRIILEDKTKIDAIFDDHGLESDVTIEIQKLKAVGFGYDSLSNFAIDFESYEKFDEYSEFALKSISAIDAYNRIKSSEVQIATDNTDLFSYDKIYTNRVSMMSINTVVDAPYKNIIYEFQQFGDYVMNNLDTALYPNPDRIYSFGELTETANAVEFTNSSGEIYLTTDGNMASAKIAICSNNIFTPILTVVENLSINSNATTLEIPESFTIPARIYGRGEFLVFAIIVTNEYGHTITTMEATPYVSFTITKKTDSFVIPLSKYIKNISVNSIFDFIFGSSVTSSLASKYALTCENTVLTDFGYINFKPSEFLADICKAFGLVVNFKNDSSVKIETINSFFASLFEVISGVKTKAHEVTQFRDVSVKASNSLLKTSIIVGSEPIKYTNYTFLTDWTKKLAFDSGRLVGDVLDLSVSTLRLDFSGIIQVLSKGVISEAKKNYLIDNTYTTRTTSDGEEIYDYFTPRDIAENWRKYLSFAFQNFGKDTLTLSSNGGTSANLQIDGVNQFDDIVLNETPRLLPIEYNFTCLIDSVDFSEKILKINHNGTDVYLFVFEAETTDNLSEQKIKALKIQF